MQIRLGTMGRCTACLSRSETLRWFPQSKKHSERHNTPSSKDIQQLGGWRCAICRQEASCDGETERFLSPFWIPPALNLGMVCTVITPDEKRRAGCDGPLGRIARGTRYGSVRYLARLRTYQVTPPDFRPRPEAVDRRCVNAAKRLQKEGVTITSADVAGLFAAAHDQCQVCHAKSWGKLSVDHDYDARVVRGILCQACNSAMQLLDLDPAYYARALHLLRDVVGIRSQPWYRQH